MATPTHDFKVNTTATAATTTTATSLLQYEKGGTVYSFLHNTFFQFPSRPVIAKKRNMEKSLLFLPLLWYM
jgi:hypothetical protein